MLLLGWSTIEDICTCACDYTSVFTKGTDSHLMGNHRKSIWGSLQEQGLIIDISLSMKYTKTIKIRLITSIYSFLTELFQF